MNAFIQYSLKHCNAFKGSPHKRSQKTHLKVSVPMRLPRRLAADLLGHDPEQLGGGLHRGVNEPGHVAAGGNRVVRIVLLLDILHQVLVNSKVSKKKTHHNDLLP